ncbi:hypothetical protein DLAC_09507 [Tieghemostelium lacteum]|uniref:Uncharacterized protein n=1 Tax=Tieghemostelium lacteum TaxID=361077 RepID=A0A151Z6G7_TIELA|nr:hypothetical protein DLAC_09507 [Tieghemostelium lacteum]|eukprot:KYQ89556.1 hypothetical protein DLAC_09507 [Tieghemostelium lacteum]
MVHYLKDTFYFYCNNKRPKNTSDYMMGLQCISGPIKSVEDFWSYYCHMIRPVDEFSTLSDIYFFKEGIKPLWEDEANKSGGKFVIKTRKNYSSKWWEDLLLAFVGDQIDGGENVNGIVVSFRSNDNNLIGIWNNNIEDTERLSHCIKNLFKIDKLDYKPHFDRILKEESLKNRDNATFSDEAIDSLGSSLDGGFDFMGKYVVSPLNSSGGGGGSNLSPQQQYLHFQQQHQQHLQQMQQQKLQQQQKNIF